MSTSYKNIARVLKTHGVKGEVVVVPLRGLPFLLQQNMKVSCNPPSLDRERFIRVEDVKPSGDGALVTFSGVTSLSDAEKLVDTVILASEQDLDLSTLDVPVDLLLNREVVDVERGFIGIITEVMIGPANNVWVIEGPFGEILLPVIEQVVLDLPHDGQIRVSLLDGMIEQ